MTETKSKVLQAVRDLEQPSITDIKEEVGTTRKNINDHLDDLRERGLISVEKTRHKHIRTITEEGEDFLLDNLSDLQQVNRSGKQVDPFFVHFFAVNCKWSDTEFLPGDWRERFKEFESMEVEEHPDFDRIQLKKKEWVYRLTGRSLEIRLRNELSGNDVETLKDRAWSRAMDGLEEFEKLIGKEVGRPDFEFPRDRMVLKVQTQHIGARRRHLTKAFIDHIDQNTVLDPRKFRVREGEQKSDDLIRIYCDASGPDGMLEGEAGNGGQVNGRMDTAEDDMSLLQDFTNDVIENPGSARRVLDTPERLDNVVNRVSEIEETMDQFSRSVSKGMEDITNTVENNVGFGDQVTKQVMEMKQVQDTLQEELSQVNEQIQKLVEVQERSQAVQSSRTASDEKIIERLEEISENTGSGSSRDSVVNPLAEHVEISNKWVHRGIGPDHLMAYSPELEKQFILIEEKDLP